MIFNRLEEAAIICPAPKNDLSSGEEVIHADKGEEEIGISF